MSSFWARWRSCLRGLDSAKTLQTNPINRRNDGQMECGRERIRLTSGESAEMMEDHQVKDHEGPKPNEDSNPINRRNDGQMECGRERIRLTSGESAEMMEDHQVKDHE